MCRISLGAPNSVKVFKTSYNLGSLDLDVSFPSEKVPAPPSPKEIFELKFRLPFSKNFLTDWVLSSIFSPLSITVTFTPLLLK